MTEQTMAIWGIVAVLFVIIVIAGLLQERDLRKSKKRKNIKKRMKIKSLKYRVR